MTLHIVLVNPEIPQNTGNIVRTCAALGAVLHLVEPLGFSIADRYLKRAGLDYWHMAMVETHPSLEAALGNTPRENIFPASARGTRSHISAPYPDPCWLVFGPESTGLSDHILDRYAGQVVRIPMREGARSLNLSNAVAVLAYEVFRQWGFDGLSAVRAATTEGEPV